MDGNSSPEQETPEVRYQEVASGVKAWLKEQGIDDPAADWEARKAKGGLLTEIGKYKTEDGRLLTVSLHHNMVVAHTDTTYYPGDINQAEQWIVGFGGGDPKETRPEEIVYRKGNPGAWGSGLEPVRGEFGSYNYHHLGFGPGHELNRYNDVKPNVDVFEKSTAMLNSLKTAQKVS